MNSISLSIFEPSAVSKSRFNVFLHKTDDLFSVPLSLRVNIDEYAEKLADNLCNFFLKLKAKTQQMHLEVIQKTRSLYPRNMSIEIDEILRRFSDYFQRKLSFSNPVSGIEQWMIDRLNRPELRLYNKV